MPQKTVQQLDAYIKATAVVYNHSNTKLISRKTKVKPRRKQAFLSGLHYRKTSSDDRCAQRRPSKRWIQNHWRCIKQESQSITEDVKQKLHLFVRTPFSKKPKTLYFELHPETSVTSLKETIQKRIGVEARYQRLYIRRNFQLCDLLTLEENGVGKDEIISLHLSVDGPNDDSVSKDKATIDDEYLKDLSSKSESSWKELAEHLGYEEAEIADIQSSNEGNNEAGRHMLLTWWEKTTDRDEAAQHLRRALEAIGLTDLAQNVPVTNESRDEAAGPEPERRQDAGVDEENKDNKAASTKEKTQNNFSHVQVFIGFHMTHKPRTLCFQLDPEASVWCLKEILSEIISVHPQQQRLFIRRNFRNFELCNLLTLSDCGIQQDENISLRLCTDGLLGGGPKTEISEPTLSDVAGKLGHDWKQLAIHLGFTSADISTFEADNPGNVNYQKFQMLVAWRRRQPTIGCQMDVLCAALARIDRNDIVTFLQGPTGGFAPLTDLTNIQQLVMEYNKDTTSTIPAHPLDPSRTLDIDQFSELELTQKVEGNETTQEPIDLPEGKRNLDKPRTKPLYSFEDMLDVLVTKLRVLLSGRAGFGKSTLLLRVANASTDPNSVMAKFKLVFPLKLSQMQQTSCVLEAIRDQILPGIEKAVLKKVIDDNEANTVFLLDGLDEIPSDVLNSSAPEGGYGVKGILHNKVLRRSTVLVSTRPHKVDFAIKEYPHYTRIRTLGFTLDTAKKYVTSYFATKGAAKKGESLISHVTSSSLMRTLAQIPILVLFLCIVWDNLSKLPDQLTALYTQFADVLVSRCCNEGEDQVALMKSVVRGLGPVALAGLLDPKGERLVFSSKEFDEKALEDGCRLGFLQQESFTSGLKMMKVVVFLHKSMQEYFAAYYFANLHHAKIEEFHERLQQINADNVDAMEYLLRFACGISSGSPATALILDHVQKQRKEERCAGFSLFSKLPETEKKSRLMFYESGCDELADKLDRPTSARCDSQEDLLAMCYYLQCLPQPLVELEDLTVLCRSQEELAPLRGIDSLLHDDTKVRIYLSITGRLHEWLKLLGVILPIGNIRSISRFWVSVAYTVGDKPDEEMQTSVVVDTRLHDRIHLTLLLDEKSHIDECVLGSQCRVCKQIIKKVALRRRTYDDVIRLANALAGCDRLISVDVSATNLHGHLADVASLFPPTMEGLTLGSCGLNDDDIPDLIRILTPGHGLGLLDVHGNAFSLVGVETLAAHLRNLPKLGTFLLQYRGHDAEHVKQLVKRNLPNVHLF